MNYGGSVITVGSEHGSLVFQGPTDRVQQRQEAGAISRQ